MAVERHHIDALQERIAFLQASSTDDNIAAARSTLADLPEGQQQLIETFALAQLLVANSSSKLQEEGLQLLVQLKEKSFKPSDVSFLEVLAAYLRGEYGLCRERVATLVTQEPTNMDAAAFIEVLKEKVMEEGPKGLALTAAATAAVILLAVGVYVWRRKK